MTGMIVIITGIVQASILRDLTWVRLVFSAAALLSSTSRGTADLRFATGSRPTPGAASLGFVLSWS